MKAQELRIDNWVSSSGCLDNVRIYGISKDCIQYEYEGDIMYDNIDYFKPIPLTEEILLKCGFKHKGNGFYEILGYFTELCNVGNEFYNCGFKGKSIGNIKHLHQLQNLYFALTNHELEIKL